MEDIARYARMTSSVAAVTLALTSGAVHAYDLPSINLGLTSFLDGVLPSGPGFYYQNYTEYYSASRFNDAQGNRLALPHQNLSLLANINQITYYFPATFGPGRFALDLVVPTVAGVASNDGIGGLALSSQAGIGDVLFAPIYQFEPSKLNNGWTVSQSLEFDVLAPIGAYNSRVAINPGSHVWALDPFYSVTLIVSPQWNFSARFHYLYSFPNNEPSASLGPNVQWEQPGQAFHVNFAASYALTQQIGIGLNGYYLQQFTDTKFNELDVLGRRERVLGLGPGLSYVLNKDTFIFLNAYFESMAQNRPQGERYIARAVHHF